MSKSRMRGHFRYLRFKTFPMTPRTPQCEVFWSSKSSSKFSGVPEDSNPNFFQVLGFTPTLGQSGVATQVQQQKRSCKSQCVHTITVAARAREPQLRQLGGRDSYEEEEALGETNPAFRGVLDGFTPSIVTLPSLSSPKL
jgi:hypothetical protein